MTRRTRLRVAAALLIALPAAAAPASEDAPASLQDANASARKDLAASLQELADLRARIAAEKLPLSRELSGLEDELASLRREYERSSRAVDQGKLDLTDLHAEVKLRQDEVTYLATLLDEYRANFESRINPSELQRYEAVIAPARNAPGNGALTSAQRFDRQIALVKTSVARLEDLLGGTRFPGKAVDPQGVLADGEFALVGPIALFAATGGSVAGMALPQTGSPNPAVRPLEASLAGGIVALVNDGKGLLPLDPTRGGAIKDMVARHGLVHIFVKGGPIMWPLLFVSILALATVVERILFLFTEGKRRDETALQGMLDAVEGGRMDVAVETGRTSRDYVCRALTYALVHREKSISNALLLAQALEIKRFTRGIAILDTVITIAPLLGLLGTVTGMMHSFSLIGGELSAPGAITGGIAEALIATAFGLGIAITALIPFNYLNSRVEEARHEMDAAATRLELLIHPSWPTGPQGQPPALALAAGAGA